MDESESLSTRPWRRNAVSGIAPTPRRGVSQTGAAEEARIEEWHLMPDHGHMLLSIPQKCAVSQVVGFIKGKSAIHSTE